MLRAKISVHDEVDELRRELQSVRLELQSLRRGMESTQRQFSSLTSPIGCMIRSFPLTSLPPSFTPMSWIPYDGIVSLHWWYASEDVQPQTRFLVINPERNVTKDAATQKLFVRFTTEEEDPTAATTSQPKPSSLLVFLGYSMPKAYVREASGRFVPA